MKDHVNPSFLFNTLISLSNSNQDFQIYVKDFTGQFIERPLGEMTFDKNDFLSREVIPGMDGDFVIDWSYNDQSFIDDYHSWSIFTMHWPALMCYSLVGKE